VCGRQIVGKPNRVIIEGAKMTTCATCAKLGSGYWKPEAVSFGQPAEKLTKRVASVGSFRREIPVRGPEDLEVTEEYASPVRQARERLGLSQEDLGKRIGEKVSVIRKVESGKMVPDHELAGKLEHVLRVRLLVPVVKPETPLPVIAPSKGVTLGEIVHLKNGRRRRPKNEGNHSQSERPV